MYDYLTEELWKELGQVEPDWFQVLTTRASSKEGNLCDSDDQEELCPNQEANFKTPLRKTAAANVALSEQSSTPQVFRRSYVASPGTDDQQENEPLPWGARSPCLFGLSKDLVPRSNYGYARPRTPNLFDLLHTPQVSPASYAQHISESLGANVHSDISWTSSLNTPPALPSTIILSKTDEIPSPIFCTDKSAVLVRELFPSLSNDSRKGVTSPQSNDPLKVLQDSDSPEASPHPTSQNPPQRSLEHSNGTCRQQLPDASKDQAICSPVASVLDCTKNSPSMFLTNSSSVLRKVKSERTKRRQEEHDSSPSDVSIESKPVFSEQIESDQAQCINPPVETEDNGLTQWSPLSLSDIPATKVANQVEDRCTTEVESECNPVRPSFNSVGFTKKKTKFIYTIDKEKHSLKNNSMQGHKLPVTWLPKADDEVGVCKVSDGKEELQQPEDITKEKLPSLLQVNTQDLDMSQLCRAFAQDFSQMPYPGAPPKVGPPPPPPWGFSPFACLTALKVARQKAKKQVEVHGEAPLNESVTELATSDSAFLSASADSSHVTVACAEKREPFHQSTRREQNEMCLEEVLLGTWTDTKDTSTQTRGSLKDLAPPLVSVQSKDCEKAQEIVNVSLPSIPVSGFKTASNKRIQILAANLQKAERLFDESDGQQQPIKSVRDKEIPTTSQNTPVNPGNLNTATCKRDQPISCDCDAEEEIPARSSAPPSCPTSVSQNNSMCPKVDHLAFDSYNTNKALPGFSSSIKPVQNATKCPGNMNTVTCQGDQPFECARNAREEIPAKSAPASLVQNGDQAKYQLTASQDADVKALCTLLEEEGSQFDLTQFKIMNLKQPGKDGSTPTSKVDKDLDPYLLSGIDFDDSFCAEANEKTTSKSFDKTNLEEPSVARQPLLAHIMEKEEMVTETAEVSVARVFKKCLKKTKHLFQDLEESTPAHKQSVENSRDTLHVRTSREEHQFVDSYNTEEPLQGFFSSDKPNQSTPKSPGNVIACPRQDGFQMASGKIIRISPRAMKKAHSVFKDCAHENGQHLVGIEPFMNVAASSSASLNLGSSIADGYSASSAGFSKAKGKREYVSAEALAQAKCILQEDQRSFSGIKHVDHRLSGFQTAGGKQVAVSFAALKKAKSLLDVCNEVEEHPACVHAFRKKELLLKRGKPLSFSANSLFDNLLSTSKCPSVSGVKTNDGQRRNATNMEAIDGQNYPVENVNPQQHNIENSANPSLEVDFCTSSGGGFSTASGKKVSVSAVSMAKAKHLLQEDNADNPSTELKHGSSSLLKCVDYRPAGFQTAKGKPVAVSSAALKKAKFLLDDCTEAKEHPPCYPTARKSELLSASKKPELSDNSLFSDITLFENLDCTSASPSVSGMKDAKTGNATIVEKMYCQNYQIESENVQHYNDVESHVNPSLDIGSLLNVSGFSTASGKKVCVSAAAMQKAKHLLQEDHGVELGSKIKHERFLGVECIDLTAGGQQVTVSSAALTTTKFLLEEKDAVEEHLACSPPLRKSDFLSASEKPVPFSAKGGLGSMTESPAMKLYGTKQGDTTSKEKLGGFPIVGVMQKKASLPNKATLEADGCFKGMMDSNDQMSEKETSVASRKALNVKMDGQNCHIQNENIQPHNNGEKHGNLSLDVGCSSLSGGGFSTASGSKLPVSAAAMAKAEHFFQEDHKDDLSTKMKHGSFSGVDRLDRPPGGFQTAGGKRVAVSSAALRRAKLLLDDCDSVKEHLASYPLSGKSEFLSDSEKPGSFSSNSLFDKLGSISGSLDKDMMDSNDGMSDVQVSKNMPKVKLGNKNAAPFVDDKNIRHHKKLVNNKVSSLGICSSSLSGSGFCTASGKSMPISDEAMTRAKSLFSEVEDENQKLHRNTSLQNGNQDSLQNAGFQTAGGRRASTLSAALKKAKSFCNDSHEDTTDVPQASTSSSFGFSTASGKKVLVSDNATARAKSLLDERVMDKDAGFQLSTAEKKANNPFSEEQGVKTSVKLVEISSCAFSAASGKPVSFSTDTLQKAKAMFDDIGLNEGVQTCTQKKTFSVPSITGIAQGQSACVSEKKTAATEEMAHEEADLHGQETSHALGREMNQTSEDPTILNLESFDMPDCTETQQLFLAQEALDCTKALLQDESLAGPCMTLESIQPKTACCRPAQAQTHGKRSAEGTELAEQPPTKRGLLDEFDRSLNSPRGSKLCPQTSSPNGLINDRPVFKYNVSLGPNITRPHRDGMGYIEAAASPTTNQQLSTVGLTFLPPFFKKTEARPWRSNIKTPAFVLPFKRQTTVVEKSSTKLFTRKTTQNSEDPHTTTSAQLMTNDFSSPSPPTDTSWGQGTPLENVELARDMQDMRIRKKKRQTVRPLPGSLFRAKTSGATRIRLKDAVTRRTPAKYTQKQLYEYGVHWHVCKITSETAEAFRFQLQLFFKKDALADESGIQLAEGGRLIPSKDGTAGKEQFYRSLCDTPGVDPKLISDEWVYNHYRWIVWKLASMERSFPQTLGGLCLTPERVLLQLKYRYDVEVDHSRRPALRKIMEKDDTPAKTLVLCVCGVVSQEQVENSCAAVWLTDGWYSVKAQLDEPLSDLLRKGRLATGGKLIIHGAQLVGSQDACAPLEAPQSLMLKIFANSSRPARWDTKLGFYRDPRPFLLPLSSLYSNGGPVCCVDIVVMRSYPVQWMERKSVGGVVFRSARAEEKEEARYHSHKQKAMEVLYAKIQAEFEQEDKESKGQLRRRSVSHRDIGGLQDGQELYEAVGDDLAGLEAHLSEQQLETLQAYCRSLMDKKQAEMQDRYRRATEKDAGDGQSCCPQRDVTPVWRLCVADSLNPTGDIYQLNIWRPSSDVQALLKEGCRYKVYNLATSDRKKRGGVAALQLTTTKKTQFQDLQTSPEWLSACFQPRVSTDFVALQNLEFDPLCGEVDLTGCVVSVVDGKGPSPAFFLVDCNLNFVKVRCFNSLLQAGLADVVKPGVLLSLSNLQLRGQSTRPTPVVYAGDLTVFSTNPKEEHLQKALGQLRNLLRVQDNFFVCAEDKLSQVLKCDVWSSVCSPTLAPKTSPTQHMGKNQPVRSLGCFTPLSRNLQPPANTSSSEKDPRSLKRGRAVDYLTRMPSPPPLFLPPGLAASPSVKKIFNPPRRANTPHTLKTVHTPNLVTVSARPPEEKEEEEAWVNDHELAMIDTQALHFNDAL